MALMIRSSVIAAWLAAGAAASVVAQQDRPAPVVLGAARPMSAVEAASRLTGAWALNEELSPVPQTGSAPAIGQPGGRFAGRPGSVVQQARTQEGLRLRAFYRELTLRPQALTLTVTFASATIVDQDGAERRVALNSKKDKLDLGTALVDSKAYWDGAALTIELDGGPQLKLFEVFQLAPTGRQMLVTLKTGEGDSPRPGQLRGHVQRVYDRVG